MNKVKEFVFETFMRLTSKTCPYGFEDQFLGDFRNLFPNDLEKDEWGNYFIKIGSSRTIFASHIDTVSKEYQKVTHRIDGNIISTDGKTTLGADDKAGVTVMLWMIKNNMPGLYYFFIGEEVGCIGSGKASQYGKFKGNYDRIISFDRRGNNSVITYQSSTRCCSDSFANALVTELNRVGMNYRTDDGGVYTDSAEFMDTISECTNISVGYNKEHTFGETQDIQHLSDLAKACLLVDWESLPTNRDFTKKEYKDYSWGGHSWGRSKSYGYHDDWYNQNSSFGKKKTRRSKKTSGRKYYSYGSDLYEFDDDDFVVNSESPYLGDFSEFNVQLESRNKYHWLINKITDDNFTLEELEVIRLQYLNSDSGEDGYFYDYLVEQYWERKGLSS